MYNLWNLLYFVVFMMIILFLFKMLFGGGMNMHFGYIDNNVDVPRIEMLQTMDEVS